MDYLREFQEALDRTRRFGFKVPEFIHSQRRFIATSDAKKIPAAIRSELGELSDADLVAECLSIHLRTAPIISKTLGVRALFTIGHIRFGDIDRFRKSEEELSDLLNTGMSGSELGVHAWLTLPSMEIIDFSLPTSMAVLNGLDSGRGGAIFKHADELDYGLSYHPQLIGEEYLRRIGAIKLVI